MNGTLTVPVLVPLDLEVLERRARLLAARPDAELAEGAEERHVAFRLHGRPCAVDARVVDRVVARLARPLPVPLADGGERLVAFVDERPVPVLDLAAFSGGSKRGLAELEGQPALLVTTPEGPVAVVVEGPVALLEDHLAFAVGGGDPGLIRTTGMLKGGTTALDPAWLQGVGGGGGPAVNLDPATRSRLVGLFVDEAQEAVEALRVSLGALLAGDVGEPLNEFGRVAHGLKGAAAALGFGELGHALHELESVTLAVRGASPREAAARLGQVGEAVEALAEGAARMSAGAMDLFPPDVLLRLRAALRAAGSGADPDAPAGAETVVGALPKAVERGSRPAAEGLERLSVPAGEVDEALRLAASVARAAAQLHEWLGAAEGPTALSAQALAASAAGLEAIIASLRLIPTEVALAGLPGEVAELGGRLGKEASLVISGGEVRADRRTLQTARGLIRHLVRNALDHGVEEPKVRTSAGKPAVGRLSISVEAVESQLRVEVADDGAGFDVAAIRKELSRRGEAGRVEALSEEQVLQHWALEGGSTRASATEVSGRGMGLSAVAQLARAAGGGVQVRSVRGLGSAVAFTLPLEVYAVEVLALSVGGRFFGIPLSAVERTVYLPAAGQVVHQGPTGRTLAVAETILPLVPLAEALGAGRSSGRERFALVVRAEGRMAALAADEVGAVTGLVPAVVPGVAEANALVSGLSRLSDGTPIAILNPRLLLDRARAVRAQRVEATGVGARGALEVVLAEDSLATREVLRVLLEEQGFKVRLAGDGEEAMARIAEAVPDVLVSDVNMPRRDGLWLTRTLRARRETERMPIVLLTSQDDDASRAAGAAAGADAYLLKAQFNASVLAETLARLGVRAP